MQSPFVGNKGLLYIFVSLGKPKDIKTLDIKIFIEIESVLHTDSGKMLHFIPKK